MEDQVIAISDLACPEIQQTEDRREFPLHVFLLNWTKHIIRGTQGFTSNPAWDMFIFYKVFVFTFSYSVLRLALYLATNEFERCCTYLCKKSCYKILFPCYPQPLPHHLPPLQEPQEFSSAAEIVALKLESPLFPQQEQNVREMSSQSQRNSSSEQDSGFGSGEEIWRKTGARVLLFKNGMYIFFKLFGPAFNFKGLFIDILRYWEVFCIFFFVL